MDKDKVIELAKRAQIGDSHGHMIRHEAENLVAFAQLVRDDYRAELLAGSGEPVAWLFQHEETGLVEIVDSQQVEWGFEKNNPRWQKIGPLHTADQQAAAVLRERERAYYECSILAEQCEDQNHAARMIRARGKE